MNDFTTRTVLLGLAKLISTGAFRSIPLIEINLTSIPLIGTDKCSTGQKIGGGIMLSPRQGRPLPMAKSKRKLIAC
jgi:hypothetical protein